MMDLCKKIGLKLLLVFIPVTLTLEHLVPDRPALVFLAAALGIVPLAGLIVQSTEQIAHRTGDAIGGLLNATFGNAPELIIAVVALRAGLIDVVRASHEVFAEYGNVGTKFAYITREGFGWMNASFQLGLKLLTPKQRAALRALTPP